MQMHNAVCNPGAIFEPFFQREANAAESIAVMVGQTSNCTLSYWRGSTRRIRIGACISRRHPPSNESRLDARQGAITHYVLERPGTASLSAQDLEALKLGSRWGRPAGRRYVSPSI